jgi:hypothetical protein
LEESPLRTGFACRPNDGDSVLHLLEVAQNRLRSEVSRSGVQLKAGLELTTSESGGQRWIA